MYDTDTNLQSNLQQFKTFRNEITHKLIIQLILLIS